MYSENGKSPQSDMLAEIFSPNNENSVKRDENIQEKVENDDNYFHAQEDNESIFEENIEKIVEQDVDEIFDAASKTTEKCRYRTGSVFIVVCAFLTGLLSIEAINGDWIILKPMRGSKLNGIGGMHQVRCCFILLCLLINQP